MTPYLLVAECPDHCRGKAKRDRLQHQALGGTSRFDVDVAAPRFPYFTVARSKAPAMQITAGAVTIQS